MDLQIVDRVALVLAGGGGLGRAIALDLAAEGAKVAIAGRHEQSIAETGAAIQAAGGRHLALTWDLGELALVEERIGAVESAHGPVDILVNITGGPPPTPASETTTEAWAEQFQKMVLSVIAIIGLRWT